MQSTDLYTRLALAARREFQTVVREKRPWAHDGRYLRSTAFQMCWEIALCRAAVALGLGFREPDVKDAYEYLRRAGQPSSSPDVAGRDEPAEAAHGERLRSSEGAGTGDAALN